MQALTFHGPRDVRCESVPDPSPRDRGDVVVEVEVAGLCGSDLHVYRGDETGLDAGTVLGHELVGRIVARGGAVRGFEVGDRVVAPFTTSCGRCFYCAAGLTSRCERGQLFGWVEAGGGLDGAQAELVRVPLAESTLVRAPEGVGPELALLAGDVLATGFFAAELAEIGPGRATVVLGCGPVGLCAVVAAAASGAEPLWAVDGVAERLALAADLGAEPLALGAGGPVEAVRTATGGRGADAVLEMVGSPEASRLAIDLLRPGGTIAAAGVHTEPGFAFSPVEAYDKNLTYRAGRCPARRLMASLLPEIAAGRYRLDRLITHRLPLAEGPAAYDLFDRKLDGCVKVVFTP